jgi:nucleoside phosphorylase
MSKQTDLQNLAVDALRDVVNWLDLQGRLAQDVTRWRKPDFLEFLSTKLSRSEVDALVAAYKPQPPHISERQLARALGLPQKEQVLERSTREELRRAMQRLDRQGRVGIYWRSSSTEELRDYLRQKCSKEEIADLAWDLRTESRSKISGSSSKGSATAEQQRQPPAVPSPATAPDTSPPIGRHRATADSRSGAKRVDFLIVTALSEELDAVLEEFPEARRLDKQATDIYTFYEATISTTRRDGATYRVLVSCLARPGPVDAAAHAVLVVEQQKPNHVLLVGIAGGRAPHVALGDVVVATQIVDYTDGRRGPERRVARYRTNECDTRLLDSSRNLRKWADGASLSRPTDGLPRAHFGAVASGGDVFADDDSLEEIANDGYGKLLAVETEGGAYLGAILRSPTLPRFLMIRGISDFADPAKKSQHVEQWRGSACKVAARFAHELLRSGPVPVDHAEGVPNVDPPRSDEGAARQRDVRAIRALWERLPTPLLDRFFQETLENLHIPKEILVIHAGLFDLIKASAFTIRDQAYVTQVQEFVRRFDESLSWWEHFDRHPGSDGYEMRVENTPSGEALRKRFVSVVRDAYTAFRGLVTLTENSWPEIDIVETNETALKTLAALDQAVRKSMKSRKGR